MWLRAVTLNIELWFENVMKCKSLSGPGPEARRPWLPQAIRRARPHNKLRSHQLCWHNLNLYHVRKASQ